MVALALALLLSAPPLVQGDGGGSASFSSESRCANLLSALQRDDVEAAAEPFDAALRSALPTTRLREVWRQVLDSLGPLQRWSLVSITPREGNDVCLADLSFATGALRATISVNTHTHEVTGFYLRRPEAAASPPSPLPSGVRAVEVSFGPAPYRLSGTLTLPTAPGRHPAAVLLAGSGPMDRDETVGASAPLRDIAHGLSARGVVVLRYDKRTRTYGAALKGKAVTVEEEVLDDALEALTWLRRRPEVDPSSVWVVGHSLGALLAPEVARRDGKVAGAVLLAPPGRPVPVLAVEQLRRRGSLPPERLAEMERVAARIVAGTARPDETFLGAPASYWMDLGQRDMVATAQRLGKPLLVLRGAEDEQVFSADLAAWAAALKQARGASVETVPGVNHFFLPAAEGGPEKPSQVDPRVIARVGDFVTGGRSP
ncbi:MAG TPA: alpha/beta fold hydrolase [Myxococcaceae bacterium]|nr:alpha/beta fold hydrolase [Myxococcaceae bacterium]